LSTACEGRTITFGCARKLTARCWRTWNRLGARADELVYEEKDERFELSAQRSRSKAFIFLESASHTASEVRFLPADRPDGPWRLFVARAPDHEYAVEHHGDFFTSAPMTEGATSGW
jgi:oligopeptidase B